MNIALLGAVQGLLAAQRGLDVASHNVSNVDTPGYSRQRMDQTASTPMGAGGLFTRANIKGQVGTGVTIEQIKRIRDQFIDRQMRDESSPMGETRVRVDVLKQAEEIFGEPSDYALAKQMTRFWNAWQDLSTNPENTAARTNLREVAVNMATTVNDLHAKLTGLRDDMNSQVEVTVKAVNSLTFQLAGLNEQIKNALVTGQNPNDLQDKRDLLLEQLAEKVQIQAVEIPSTGAVNVYMGGQPLVVEDTQQVLRAIPNMPGTGYFTVEYGNTGAQADLRGGALKGIMDARDVMLSSTDPAGFIKQLNDLAQEIVTRVNTQHQAGWGLDAVTGRDFFAPTPAGIEPAAFMRLDAAILAVPGGTDAIAAASNNPTPPTSGPGDNGNAVALAQLREGLFMLGTYSFDDYYRGVLTQAGTASQEAQRKQETQELLIVNIKERQQQISGVSTDEEMASVMRYQKAYAASARIITTVDEMLEKLLSTGVVGR